MKGKAALEALKKGAKTVGSKVRGKLTKENAKRAAKVTAKYGAAALGGAVASGVARGIQKEKKNPKFAFSRTRKFWNREGIKTSRLMASAHEGEAKRHKKKLHGWRAASQAREAKKWRGEEKRHKKNLKRLGG